MQDLSPTRIESLKVEWTDQYVRANAAVPELARFGQTVGRVVTVNWNGKAIVDFQDGAWYDITASESYLTKIDPSEAKAKFNAKMNSAQAIPDKQA